MGEVDNSQDVLDSRDVIACIEELESELESLQEKLDDAQESWKVAHIDYGEAVGATEVATAKANIADCSEALNKAQQRLSEWEVGEGDELKALKALAEEAEGCSDWQYGETLIRDSYFEDYAQELASDIGAINRDADWPLNCIDWAEAAEQLQQDYTSVDYDGVTYWIRS